MKDIERHENQDQALIKFSQLYGEPWCGNEHLELLYKTISIRSEIKRFKATKQGLIYVISTTNKVASLITWRPSTKKFIIIKFMLLF